MRSLKRQMAARRSWVPKPQRMALHELSPSWHETRMEDFDPQTMKPVTVDVLKCRDCGGTAQRVIRFKCYACNCHAVLL